jgi:Cu(I)/Ag(I) efflux system periplasmic protein CusF
VRTAASANATDTVAAEVRKVDKSAGKITLTHEPIPNLEMPKMTMVFRIKDPAMLDHVRSGDNVRFAAERIDGMLTVVRLDLPN